MTNPSDEGKTIDLDPTQQAEALRQRFEAAWQTALAGGPAPQIDVYLSQVPEGERAAIRTLLEDVERSHQPRQDQANSLGTAIMAPADPDVTLPDQYGDRTRQPAAKPDLTAHLLPAGPDETIEHVSKEAAAGVATVHFSPKDADGTEVTDFSIGPFKSEEVPERRLTVAGYEILGELGRGGMGVVYKARQAKLSRVVALKMVLAGVHAGSLQMTRFFTEAEAVARLQHPNIVQIYEVGEHDGLPYFSLEYVDGGSLDRKIARQPQPPREAAQTVELLALAMAAAHECGIIHRDLKPANVLITRDGLPKISDFGLAKRLEDDSSQTKSGTLMGTPSYMAPEQARGETHALGPLSDLYSLGAILYEMLTGRPPFVGTTMMETLFQVRNHEPVPPTRLQPKCPRDLETICLKCLQKEPHQRYANCEALAADLHRFQKGEPIQARPVGRLERGWRWCRRNPRIAALSAAVALLLLAVVVSLSVVAVRLGREREAFAETRKVVGQRMEQVTEAIAGGNYHRAQDLLQGSDALLGSHRDLEDVRAELETLKAQVDVYAEFRKLLDSARFTCRFGTPQQKEEGRRNCRQLLTLYDEIEQRTGRGTAGLPPLNEEQQQLFKEDVFEAFLTAAQVERELAKTAGDEARRQAAQQAVDWLNRAEKLLPDTRALYVNRAECWGELGNTEADRADIERTKSIMPTSAVDLFWHGFANHSRGDLALRKKDVKAAHEFFRLAIGEYAASLQTRPDHFWGYFNWAYCHAHLNERLDLYDAMIGFSACIRLRPELPWPYNNRGTVHLRLGNPTLAVADFNATLARSEQYAEAHANRGLAYKALGQTDSALADFSRAIELNPDYVPAYVERAEIHSGRKQFAEAARDYTRLLALGADRGPLLEKRAAAYLALKQADAAIGDFGQVLTLNPKNLQARAARAELLLAQARYAEGREDLSRILEAAPRAAAVWRMRAVVNWLYLKEFDAALSDWTMFAQLAPKDPEPHRNIGAILLGRRQYAPALKALQQALDLRPGYPEAVWARAQIYLWEGKPEEALKELDPLAARLPNSPPETLNVRAGVYQAMGQLEKAATDYHRMTVLRPTEPEAYVNLARVYEKLKQPRKAAECYDRLVASAGQSEWAYLRRAEYRRDRGEHEAALADCDQAAKLKPAWALPTLVRASVEVARGGMGPGAAERALEKAPKHDGHVFYAAACVWSLAARAAADPAEAKRHADRAASLLVEALDRGFHDFLYPEHNRMADDPALAPIRQHPQVRDLLAHKP